MPFLDAVWAYHAKCFRLSARAMSRARFPKWSSSLGGKGVMPGLMARPSAQCPAFEVTDRTVPSTQTCISVGSARNRDEKEILYWKYTKQKKTPKTIFSRNLITNGKRLISLPFISRETSKRFAFLWVACMQHVDFCPMRSPVFYVHLAIIRAVYNKLCV